MNWNQLNSTQQIEDLLAESKQKKVLIFKHSNTCSISAMALNRLERNWKDEETVGVEPYFLVVQRSRDVSNKIEDEFGIRHESPQAIVLENGIPIYNASHGAIDYNAIKAVGSPAK